MAFCPRCGAELPVELMGRWFETSSRCRDCGVAPADPPPMLAPSPGDVEYGLDAWPVTDRTAVSAALLGQDIRYRWEEGLVLVVPAAAEAEVDRLLDEVEAAEAAEAGSARGQAGASVVGDEADGGEEATAAMDELFLAADRLQHSPGDERAAADLAAAGSAARASLPPYGIDASLWRRVQDMASALAGRLDADADADGVMADARALRDLLRDYV